MASRQILIRTVCTLLVLLVGIPAYSQGNLHLGALDIHPSFFERIEFDDNVYQVSGKGVNVTGGREDKESDLINIYTPGLELKLPFRNIIIPSAKRGHDLNFDWHSDFKNYRHHADQNQQNHYINASGNFRFHKGFEISIENTYEDTEAPAGSETDRIHPRKTNIGSVTVSLPDYFRRFDIDFTYTNFDQEYEEGRLNRPNRNEDRFTLKAPIKLTPKIVVFPGYTHGITEYDRSSSIDSLSDSHFNEIFAGAEWYATAKTTGILKLGYRSRDYDDIEKSDIDTFVALMGVQSKLPKRIILNLNFVREQFESEFTAGSNGFVSNRGDFSISHKIMRKITTTLYGDYEKQVYRNSTRKDDIYSFRFSTQYDMNKWVLVDLYYSYRDKHSNFELESDRINKAAIGIGLAF